MISRAPGGRQPIGGWCGWLRLVAVRIETLEQMVRSGVEWPLIESAAGDDPDTLRELKERLDTERNNGRTDGTDQVEPPR